MMQRHRMVNHGNKCHISIWLSTINIIFINKQICEESSWIPPTCYPASSDVSTIPIPLQGGISWYMGFYKYPLNNGAIGSHPLYEAGNQIRYIHMPIYIYRYIYSIYPTISTSTINQQLSININYLKF